MDEPRITTEALPLHFLDSKASTAMSAYDDGDDWEDEEAQSVRHRFITSSYGNLNGQLYNDLYPSHTRNVMLVMGIMFCLLVVVLFLIVFEWESIVRFMKVNSLVPKNHHMNVFKNQVGVGGRPVHV